ncbi:MAG: malto-oligosyltrehalose synthase [Planctomycetota bacterium]|nr:malto-oligosyltrehalose synthase [Planctomycetota bacterium]
MTKRGVPNIIDALFESETRAIVESAPRRPGATYRLQLHKGFRLEDALAIVPYLDGLGITDLYLSPFLDARPSSTHGYDVFDHGRINSEVGDDAMYSRLIGELKSRGMGCVLDIVPNHMGINGPNRFWLDVLEMGPHSPFAGFFDIDWHPVKQELDGRVLLPILEEQYGKVLEDGKLAIRREGGVISLHYHGAKLPLSPGSYATILGRVGKELSERFEYDDPDVLEYMSIWSSAEKLPSRNSGRPEDIEHLLRERQVLPRRIARLCEQSPLLRNLIDRSVESFRGTPGDPASFDALHQLLEEQVYRLAFWKVASQDINYRRFFDINDLAGLRAEDPRVFEAIHSLIFDWIVEGGVTGVRIDHPDGLADPSGYFRQLQESVFLIRCRIRFDAEGNDPMDWPATAAGLRKRFRKAAAESSTLARLFPIVAEKILSRGESLPDDWPIDGTVGYEFLNVLNGLFIDPEAADVLDSIYVDFTGDRDPFSEILYRAKRLIARASLASEINALARQLNRVSESDRRTRDFSLNDLRQGIREVIACFPVYRTYLQPGAPASDRDRGIIQKAVNRARLRVPSLDATVFDFLRSVLLNEYPEGIATEARALRNVFVRRFQQTTGPIQAKGLEDTAFYRRVKLISLNEVGADPWRFGHSPGVFHAMNAERLGQWPGSLGTTATHDTKRGEDARIRINILSEIPEEWRAHLARWSRCNARMKASLHDAAVPDPREEYLLYQTLIGVWPFESPEEAAPAGLIERVQAYLAKAVREAKINTSWHVTDNAYVESLATFVKDILAGPVSAIFIRDFLPFQRRIARVGVVHSLAQTLLKLTSPGVPDIFQGCELWDFSLVDPDNRRPVDYEARRKIRSQFDRAVDEGHGRSELARDLFAHAEDGAIKQYVIATVLRYRRDHPGLFAGGHYRPLLADGALKGHVVSFGRHIDGHAAITVVPRLVAGLMGEHGTQPPVGRDIWGDTRLILPEGPVPKRWRDLLTGRVHDVKVLDGAATFPIGDLFSDLPLAFLVSEGS